MKASFLLHSRSNSKTVHLTPSCLDRTSVARTTSCTSSSATRILWTKTWRRSMPRGQMSTSRSSIQTRRLTSTLWVRRQFERSICFYMWFMVYVPRWLSKMTSILSACFIYTCIHLCTFLKCTFSPVVSPEPRQQLRDAHRPVQREPRQPAAWRGASSQPTQRGRWPKWLQARRLGREGQDSWPWGCQARWLVTTTPILVL